MCQDSLTHWLGWKSLHHSNIYIEQPEKTEVKIMLYSVFGNKISQSKILFGDEIITSIETGNLSPGHYVLQITSGDETFIHKISVMK